MSNGQAEKSHIPIIVYQALFAPAGTATCLPFAELRLRGPPGRGNPQFRRTGFDLRSEPRDEIRLASQRLLLLSHLLRKWPLRYSFFGEAQSHFLPTLSGRSTVNCLSERESQLPRTVHCSVGPLIPHHFSGVARGSCRSAPRPPGINHMEIALGQPAKIWSRIASGWGRSKSWNFSHLPSRRIRCKILATFAIKERFRFVLGLRHASAGGGQYAKLSGCQHRNIGNAANLPADRVRAAGGPGPNRGCKTSKAGVGGAPSYSGPGLEGLSALRE